MNIVRKRISLIFMLFASASFAQLAPQQYFKRDKGHKIKINVKKFGPYFGLQRGKFTIAEVGVEYIWKKIQLSTAKTNGINAGFNYNFLHNVLGYDVGYFIKPTRVGLTYGASAVMRTDFDETRVGIAPVIGYQFSLFHLQTGYHFLTKASHDIQTNSFFVSLRLVLINNRNIEVKKGNKKLFEKKK